MYNSYSSKWTVVWHPLIHCWKHKYTSKKSNDLNALHTLNFYMTTAPHHTADMAWLMDGELRYRSVLEIKMQLLWPGQSSFIQTTVCAMI